MLEEALQEKTRKELIDIIRALGEEVVRLEDTGSLRELEELKNSRGCLDCKTLDRLKQELRELEDRYASQRQLVIRYEEAILWVLGEKGCFRLRRDDEGMYWWRTELRQRADIGN